MRAALIGYGSMGKLIKEELGPEVVAIIAPQSPDLYTSLLEYDKIIDVILDFSNPANLDMIYNYAVEHKTPVVIGTTGYSKEQLAKIKKLSKIVPVLISRNFSVGANLVNKIIKQITPYIYDEYDIELLEKGPQSRIDTPCEIIGQMLLDSIKKCTGGKAKYGRKGNLRREANEIGFHQIRGGDLEDEHDVLYLGEDDIIEIRHRGISRARFARGAIHAAEWIIGKKPNLYSMEDILF
ncbi:MAG: 4-hydroxy-tetrahydrodipicolinate reductase [Acholeplasmatales bacterium]|nr:4-hydroxy-tetrahydrodipicolinate reductase [Acholeplasmatales bacterium]